MVNNIFSLQSFKVLSLGLVSALVLTACATTKEECDPSKDPGFFNKISCSVSGSYSERIEEKQQTIADLKAENERLNALTRSIYESNAIVEGSIAERQRALDHVNFELIDIERSLKQKQAYNDKLQKQIEDTKAQVKVMQQSTGKTQSLIEKEQQVQELQAQLDEMRLMLQSYQ